MKRVLVIGALASALTGCGTVGNFRGDPLNATPYGGVKIATAKFNEDPIAVAIMWPFWATDLGLSAVGDTLTLPFTICAAVVRSINAYYFPSEQNPPTNAWRDFWSNDPPPTAPQAGQSP